MRRFRDRYERTCPLCAPVYRLCDRYILPLSRGHRPRLPPEWASVYISRPARRDFVLQAD